MSISQIDINATKLDFVRKSYNKYLGRCPSRWLSSNYSWQKREEEVEGIRWGRRKQREEERLRRTMDPAWMRHNLHFLQESWIEAMFHLECELFPTACSRPNSMDITWEMMAIEKSQPPPPSHPNLNQNLHKIPRLSTCKLNLVQSPWLFWNYLQNTDYLPSLFSDP